MTMHLFTEARRAPKTISDQIVKAMEKGELSFWNKPFRCKVRNHDHWPVSGRGVMAAETLFVCRFCGNGFWWRHM